MTVFMFWNIQKGKAMPYVGSACIEYNVDVLVVAEADNINLQSAINSVSVSRPYLENVRSPSKVRFFSRLPFGSTVVLADEARASSRLIKLPVGGEVLLIGVHLPSKRDSDEEERYYNARILRGLIERSETNVGHNRTLVIGDFNMDPFETPMIAPDGLHGMLDKKTAERISRRYVKQDHLFLYNPMWSKLGDESDGPSGTHWFNAGGVRNIYWNYYDQALIRPSLIPYYRRVSVITQVGGVSLIENGKINNLASDHLPIMIDLDLEHSQS